MKNFLPVLFALLIAITFTSCASFERNMVIGDKQKTVYYPNMKQVGDFYVVNFMNQRTSKIGIQILDRYQEPFCGLVWVKDVFFFGFAASHFSMGFLADYFGNWKMMKLATKALIVSGIGVTLSRKFLSYY